MNYTQINFDLLLDKYTLKSLKFLRSNNLIIICSNRHKDLIEKIIVQAKNIYNYQIIEYNFKKEPTLEIVQEILMKIKKIPDKIVAIGGGAIIDTAKAVKALFNEKFPIIIGKKKNIIRNSEILDLELIAVPSILGSGSEVSSSSVLFVNEKNYLVSKDLIPNKVIYDLDLYSSLTKNQKLYGLGDSIVHIVESFFSKLSSGFLNSQTKFMLNQAYNLLKNDDIIYDNFKSLILFSFWGGIFQDRFLVGPSHCLAHNLSLSENRNHAETVSFLFPKIFDELCIDNKNKKIISQSIDFDFNRFLNLFEEKISSNSKIKSLRFSSIENVKMDPAGKFFGLNIDNIYEKFI